MFSSKQDQLLVFSEGTMTSLYDDDLPPVGIEKQISRASNVEPDFYGGWTVVLSDNPRNGPWAGKLIGASFGRRADALAFERRFIQENILGKDFSA